MDASAKIGERRLSMSLWRDVKNNNNYGASISLGGQVPGGSAIGGYTGSLTWTNGQGFGNSFNYTFSNQFVQDFNKDIRDPVTGFLTSMWNNTADAILGAGAYVAGLFKNKKKERVGHITIAENDITAKAFQLGKFSGLKGEELANAVNYQEVTNEYGGTGVLVLDANGKVIREIWNGAEGSFNIFDSNGKLARIKNLPAGADDAGFLDPIDNPIAGILKNILKGSSRTILKAIDKKVVKETIEEGAKGANFLKNDVINSAINEFYKKSPKGAINFSEQVFGGKYLKISYDVPANVGGQARKTYVKIINQEGKTVKYYKDTFSKDGKFWQRKHSYPNEWESKPYGDY